MISTAHLQETILEFVKEGPPHPDSLITYRERKVILMQAVFLGLCAGDGFRSDDDDAINLISAIHAFTNGPKPACQRDREGGAG